jgi:hypothetical protein
VQNVAFVGVGEIRQARPERDDAEDEREPEDPKQAAMASRNTGGDKRHSRILVSVRSKSLEVETRVGQPVDVVVDLEKQ